MGVGYICLTLFRTVDELVLLRNGRPVSTGSAGRSGLRGEQRFQPLDVMDPNYSVVVKVRKSFFTGGQAFTGMHRELRSRAYGLA